MTKDLANLDEARRARQDFLQKREEVSRMIRQMEPLFDKNSYEEEALMAFINVKSRYTHIIAALERRIKQLETS